MLLSHYRRALSSAFLADARYERETCLQWLERIISNGDHVCLRLIQYCGAAAATPEILSALEYLLQNDSASIQELSADAFRGIGAAAATPKILLALASLHHSNIWSTGSAADEVIARLSTRRQLLKSSSH
jgi:hypothetical protein